MPSQQGWKIGIGAAAANEDLSHCCALLLQAPLLPLVTCIVILDEDGGRVSAKYYNKREFPDHASQTEFESKLWKKTKNVNARVEADIALLDERVAVFRSGPDVHLYVVGSTDENELILAAVLDALHDALSALLRGQVHTLTITRT